ncbi:hypothetical protein [Petroclostridium sp. X23]|uniref:hypothetical protein n=1 Tax=Petroclostridium sp. X23 TaxID=3045146 RepID=UPI0024AE6119|nr:hypothetical protein [Petroclostridium sp. X23]WHH61141.1 hypothetical protein QKW49_10730 [Petroclostridium sp. X23]
MTGMNLEPIWWALSLGACFGGNGTVLGGSDSVIARGMGEDHGEKITFGEYFRLALPLMIRTIIFDSIYLLIFYIS